MTIVRRYEKRKSCGAVAGVSKAPQLVYLNHS